MKNTFKKFIDLCTFLALITVGFVFFKIYENNRLEEKFESTNLYATLSVIKSSWGQPDSEFMYDGNQILKYSDFLGMGNYILVFDNEKQMLVGKFYDD